MVHCAISIELDCRLLVQGLKQDTTNRSMMLSVFSDTKEALKALAHKLGSVGTRTSLLTILLIELEDRISLMSIGRGIKRALT